MATLNRAPAPPAEDAAPEGDLRTAVAHRRRRVPAPRSWVAYSLGLATVCTVAAVNLVAGGTATPATASPQEQSASVAVADALGIEETAAGQPAVAAEDPRLLEQLAATRAERDAEQAAAAAVQAQAEQAAVAARAEAEARAAAEAAAAEQRAAEAAAAEQRAAEARAAAVAEAPSRGASAAAPAPAGTAASAKAKISNSAGAVRPAAQAAADAVVSNVPGAADITIGGTRASAADPGGHPSGLALDYMCTGALGDAIAQYHIAHWDELGVEYIIWEQRMLSSPGGSWKPMADRGSATANHYDHVHVNYRG